MATVTDQGTYVRQVGAPGAAPFTSFQIADASTHYLLDSHPRFLPISITVDLINGFGMSERRKLDARTFAEWWGWGNTPFAAARNAVRIFADERGRIPGGHLQRGMTLDVLGTYSVDAVVPLHLGEQVTGLLFEMAMYA